MSIFIVFLFLISTIGSLTQSIRNFAKSLETWLSSAMVDCPREMTVIKVYIRKRLIDCYYD